MQWCCTDENHKEGGMHYHMAMKLKRVTSWIGSEKYLKERHGIPVVMTTTTVPGVTSQKVTKVMKKVKVTRTWKTMECQKLAKPKKQWRKMVGKGGPRGSTEMERRLKKRLTAFELSQVMLPKKIKTMTVLQALANKHKRRKTRPNAILLSRSRKVVTELLETT